MQTDRSQSLFTRPADGTTLLRQPDGTFHPVASETDHERLALLSDDEIERMASADPDHPALDEAFWADVTALPIPKEAISIKLDEDILSFFRKGGRGYQTRINAVLRRYVDAKRQQPG